MALFTVVLQFDGGTYTSQFQETSVQNAAVKHAAHLVRDKKLSTLANRRRLADRLSMEPPLAIEGVRNVWCCSAAVGRKFARVFIVATA